MFEKGPDVKLENTFSYQSIDVNRLTGANATRSRS